jgi:hypothetical protein
MATPHVSLVEGYGPIQGTFRSGNKATSKQTKRTMARLAYCDTFLTDGKPLPLPIMIENMRIAFDIANQADKAANMKALRDMTDEHGKVPLKEAFAALKAAAMLAADMRDRSNAYAAAAAPYIHPRLTAVKLTTAPPAEPDADPADAKVVEELPPSPLMLELSAWDDAATKFDAATTEKAKK